MREGLLRGVALTLSLVAAVVYGCGAGDGGPPNPVPLNDTTSASSSSSPATGGAGGSGVGGLGGSAVGGAGVIKRQIMMRNPLGGPPGNLLVDGDFELSTTYEGYAPQFGWRAFSSWDYSSVSIRVETGGLCRRGLRCAVLEHNAFFLGMGASAKGATMRGSIWAKVPTGTACDVINPYFVRSDFSGDAVVLEATSTTPDEAGWCEYSGWLWAMNVAPYLFIDNSMEWGQAALVDAALLEPITGTVPKSAPVQLSPQRQQRVRRAIERLRRQRRFGKSPPIQRPRRGRH